jgi:myosin heavy subunit
VNVTRNESIVTPLNASQAYESRDALAKYLYGHMFTWLVKVINDNIEQMNASTDMSASLTIGVLDIFGFEDFEVNSFEQLCINYANEKLHQFFIHNVFKIEQEEYKKEGITWSDISVVDNQLCLDMISKVTE